MLGFLRIARSLLLLLLFVSFPAVLLPYPAQEESLQELYQQAQAAQAAGDLKTATQKYVRIITLRPDVAEAYANLGRLYFQQQQWGDAERCLKKAVKLKPGLAGPHFFLGVLAFNGRQYKEALSYLKRADSLDQSEIATTLYLGYTAYALLNYLDAVRHFQKVAKVRPDDPDVLYYLSKSYGQAAKHQLKLLQQAFPDSFYMHLARGHAYEAQSKWENAISEYNLAQSQQPGNARLKQRLAWLSQNNSGHPLPRASDPQDELIDGSLRFLYAPPEASEVQSELGRYESLVERDTGRVSAESIYSLAENYQVLSYLTSLRVFEVDPESYRAHQLKAQYYVELGKDDEALKEYQAAASLKPDLPDLHFEIGTLYWKSNRLQEALPEFKQELSIQPNHPQALYEAADILSVEGKLREAEQYLLKALSVEPAMAEARLALEKIYTSKGRYSESLAELKRVSELTPEDPTPHYRMATILRKIGKQDEAQREMAIFTRLQSESTSH
jgi:tetratricopeptide (TPR) repeat protein